MHKLEIILELNEKINGGVIEDQSGVQLGY